MLDDQCSLLFTVMICITHLCSLDHSYFFGYVQSLLSMNTIGLEYSVDYELWQYHAEQKQIEHKYSLFNENEEIFKEG